MLFPHVWQDFSDKLHAIKIEDHTSRAQALEFTNKAHQQTIEERDAALTHRDNQIQAIYHENVTLQAQRDVYQVQLQRCQDQIRDLIINCHVPRVNYPGKDNIAMIVEKNTTSEEDEFY